MSDTVLKYLADKIQEEVSKITDDMAMGGAKHYDDYRYACGIIRGLLIVTSLIADTAERLEEDDEN